ncbi:uncharacterized protein B0H64DRAFT_447811 [Chaetomium fimeti]|uniref:Uncharacterized protein n=1 Tax=Chaetomium fimeti TaxID=1854472 RepID=A0AAE0HQF0_9PEZI|nr:hypothetical protein B0H64DRAFT_447811 [Chaetomium fimeti]
MATTGLVVSIIGTGVSILSFLLGQIPSSDSGTATVSYVIANDGANGDLTGAGGHKPDVRMWDQTAEFLGITTQDGDNCGEGWTTCTTDVSTREAPVYTLFTGNDDAICIAWTGISFPGGNQKFGFHPGQWARGCDIYGNGGGAWYYAGTTVPGLNDNEHTVYCAWVDGNGDVETTGFQVHWPEFDGSQSDARDISYYCDNQSPVSFRTEPDPSTIWTWQRKRNIITNTASAGPGREATRKRQAQRLGSTFENDPRIIKSRRAQHSASELCDPNGKAAGQSFVSYAERMFCHMPTKTLYPFCEDVAEGACWSDADNAVTAKGSSAFRMRLPDMSHINKTIVWE